MCSSWLGECLLMAETGGALQRIGNEPTWPSAIYFLRHPDWENGGKAIADRPL